jgi:hypothetical protein
VAEDEVVYFDCEGDSREHRNTIEMMNAPDDDLCDVSTIDEVERWMYNGSSDGAVSSSSDEDSDSDASEPDSDDGDTRVVNEDTSDATAVGPTAGDRFQDNGLTWQVHSTSATRVVYFDTEGVGRDNERVVRLMAADDDREHRESLRSEVARWMEGGHEEDPYDEWRAVAEFLEPGDRVAMRRADLEGPLFEGQWDENELECGDDEMCVNVAAQLEMGTVRGLVDSTLCQQMQEGQQVWVLFDREQKTTAQTRVMCRVDKLTRIGGAGGAI